MAGAYAVPLSYNFEDVDEVLQAFEAEKPLPLNTRQIVSSRMGREDGEEMGRVLTHAVVLYWATGEGVSIWDCLFVAWVFERG